MWGWVKIPKGIALAAFFLSGRMSSFGYCSPPAP